MANELTLTGQLVYDDGTDSADAAITDLIVSVSTQRFTKIVQSVGFASEEPIILGDVSSLGWAMLVNLDPVNFINIKTATSGIIFAKLLAGEFCLLRLGSGAQVPYAIADTAACRMAVLICAT